VLGRPFINVNTGMPDRQVSTTPEFNQGVLNVHSSTGLFGGDINSRILMWYCCDFQWTGLVGFRYLDLRDHLDITESSVFINAVPGFPGNPPVVNAGDHVFVFDHFETHNQFYGGQIGGRAQWQRGPWSLDATLKVALGATVQSVDINGGQVINRATGAVQTFQGGLLALPGNIGHFSQTRFAVAPELGLKLGYNITEHIRIFIGYDFLYLSSVLRAGDQIDPVLDANRIPNFGANFAPASSAHPVVPFRTSSYWAQGLNAGLEFRY
jgi:hypothetical protein